MDTSKEYIKMCERAEEIQNLKFPDFCAGDWYISHSGYPFVMGSILPLGESLHRRGEIWLPCQDQLQEIVREYKRKQITLYDMDNLLFNFWNFIDLSNASNNRVYTERFHSMEQLWLAFVMSEKYGKVWNGKEWVREDK